MFILFHCEEVRICFDLIQYKMQEIFRYSAIQWNEIELSWLEAHNSWHGIHSNILRIYCIVFFVWDILWYFPKKFFHIRTIFTSQRKKTPVWAAIIPKVKPVRPPFLRGEYQTTVLWPWCYCLVLFVCCGLLHWWKWYVSDKFNSNVFVAHLARPIPYQSKKGDIVFVDPTLGF